MFRSFIQRRRGCAFAPAFCVCHGQNLLPPCGGFRFGFRKVREELLIELRCSRPMVHVSMYCLFVCLFVCVCEVGSTWLGSSRV